MKVRALPILFFIVPISMTATTLIVTNTNDSGPGSLRQTLIDSSDGDAIDFALPLPAVIELTTSALSIDKDVAIVGSGANLITIEQDSPTVAFHVLDVAAGHTVSISGITISKGVADPATAGGVTNLGNLTMTSCAVVDNSANDFGIDAAGGIANFGTLSLVDCTVANNATFYAPAGLYSETGR
jgi:hypothetical protein